MDRPAIGLSGFPSDTAEHLAMIATAHANGSMILAIERMRGAIEVLMRWQADRIYLGPIQPGAND